MKIILAILPVILIGFYIYLKDKRKEPINILFKLFILGTIITIPVGLLEVYISPLFKGYKYAMALNAIIGVALIEEISKYIITKKFGYNSKECDDTYDPIVYAVFVSLGFACFENILYVLSSSESAISVAIARGITAVPLHAVCGIYMGYYLSLYKSTNKKRFLYGSLLIPIIIHGLYDYYVMSPTIKISVFIPLLTILFVETLHLLSCESKLDKKF